MTIYHPTPLFLNNQIKYQCILRFKENIISWFARELYAEPPRF